MKNNMKDFNREECINDILKRERPYFNHKFLEGLTDEDLYEWELEILYGLV